MKANGGLDVYRSTFFFTSALVRGEWSASRPCRFTTGERAPGTHWIGELGGSQSLSGRVEKRKFLTLPGLELRPLAHPARSQSLYRLRSNTWNKHRNTQRDYIKAFILGSLFILNIFLTTKLLSASTSLKIHNCTQQDFVPYNEDLQ
jgi:hypothetical protein